MYPLKAKSNKGKQQSQESLTRSIKCLLYNPIKEANF